MDQVHVTNPGLSGQNHDTNWHVTDTMTWYVTDIALIQHWHTSDNLTWHTIDIALTIWHNLTQTWHWYISDNLTWHTTDTALTIWWHTTDTAMTIWWHTTDTAMTIWWHATDTALTIWWHATDTALTIWWHATDTALTIWWHTTDTAMTIWWHATDTGPTEDRHSTDTALTWHWQPDTSHHWHTGIHMTHCDGSDTALIIWHVKHLTCQAIDFTATVQFFVENNHATYFDLLWLTALQRDISIQWDGTNCVR